MEISSLWSATSRRRGHAAAWQEQIKYQQTSSWSQQPHTCHVNDSRKTQRKHKSPVVLFWAQGATFHTSEGSSPSWEGHLLLSTHHIARELQSFFYSSVFSSHRGQCKTSHSFFSSCSSCVYSNYLRKSLRSIAINGLSLNVLIQIRILPPWWSEYFWLGGKHFRA